MKEETKEKASKLWDGIKSSLKTGFAATKKGLTKAGTAIQSYGDLGVVQIEKKQLELKVKKAYAALGELAAKKFSAKNPAPLTADDKEVAELLKEIASVNKEIAKRDKIIKDAEKEGGASAKKPAAKTGAKKAPAKKKTAAKKASESAE